MCCVWSRSRRSASRTALRATRHERQPGNRIDIHWIAIRQKRVADAGSALALTAPVPRGDPVSQRRAKRWSIRTMLVELIMATRVNAWLNEHGGCDVSV